MLCVCVCVLCFCMCMCVVCVMLLHAYVLCVHMWVGACGEQGLILAVCLNYSLFYFTGVGSLVDLGAQEFDRSFRGPRFDSLIHNHL